MIKRFYIMDAIGDMPDETKAALQHDLMATGSYTVHHRKDGTIERVSPERFYLPPKETEK